MSQFTPEEIHEEILKILLYIHGTVTEHNLWYSLGYGSSLGCIREKGFIKWDLDADVYIQLPQRDKIREVLKENLPDSMEYIDSSTSDNSVNVFDNIRSKKMGEFAQVDLYTLIGAPDEDKISKRREFLLILRNRIYTKLTCTKYGDAKKLRKKIKVVPFYIIKGFLHLIPNKVIRAITTKIENQYPFDKAQRLLLIASGLKMGTIMKKEVFLEVMDGTFENHIVRVQKNYHEYLSGIYGNDYMTPKKF